MLSRTFAEGILHFAFLTKEGVFTVGSSFNGAFGVGEIERCTGRHNKIRKMINLEGEQVIGVGCCSMTTTLLTKSGKLFSCGKNDCGQLGTGNTTDKNKPTIVPFPPEYQIRDFHCGHKTVLVLTTTGKIFGWGCNDHAQLGLGHNNSPQTKPSLIETLSSHKILSVACGIKHTIAITEEGKLFSWGWNEYGQLGSGYEAYNHTPKIVPALSHDIVTQIACGYVHSMALVRKGNKTFCFSWGSGKYGQLGHGNKVHQFTPKLIDMLKQEKIVLIDCGWYHSLAIAKGTTMFMWGRNNCSQLCLEDKIDRYIPTLVKISNKKDIEYCCCGGYSTALFTKRGILIVYGENHLINLFARGATPPVFAVEIPLSSKILLPLKVSIEKALRECAKVVLLVLSPFFNPKKRKREGKQVWLYFPRDIWIEILRRAFFDGIVLMNAKEREEATLKAWKIGMK